MGHVWRRRDLNVGFWCGNPNERDYLEDLGTEGRIGCCAQDGTQ